MTFDFDSYFTDDARDPLDETTYKEILHHVDPRDLPHRDYAPLIPYVRYVDFRQSTMKFFVPNRYNGWDNYVRFPQFEEQAADTSINANEAARLLLWNDNIQIHCHCPSFKFYGYQYILGQLDAAIVPEERFPHIRNPELKGICCKHLRRAIKVLPFHLGKLAAQIKIARERPQG